ncbi:MAG TPA: hypothetical protein VFT29_10555, partial [Gemmatimonadaceae bacterium]|nr:hypothetical protein [Gemmatimonadaceae bacterium]
MTFRITRSALTCACAALILAACDDTTSPLTATGQFGQQISLSDFETAINGTAFVEIEFATATGLVAREIDVEADDDDEKVSSRVTAINTTAGTVTLQLGGFVVSYTNNTRFRTPTNSNATRAVWEAQVQSELAAGRNPPIEARRDVPATPQAPANATFTATDLRLTNDFDGAK